MGYNFDDEFYKFAMEREKHATQKLKGLSAARWARRFVETKYAVEITEYREFISHIYQNSDDLKLIKWAEELLARFR